MLTQILKGLLVAVILSSTMAAQPLVTIQSVPADNDIAAAGVKLVPINAPEHAAALNAILADDANLLAPLLPYSVLIVNGSSKKLRAAGVFFRWSNPKSPKGTTVVLTALDKEDPRQPKPGEIQLFTPVQVADTDLSVPATMRKPPTSGNSVVSAGRTDFSNLLQQGMNNLSGLAGVQASIDSIVFEDYSYVGSDGILQMLQRSHPEVHR